MLLCFSSTGAFVVYQQQAGPYSCGVSAQRWPDEPDAGTLHPAKINEYLFEDREEKSRLHIMKDADAHIMYFGHTHKPCHRIL